MTADFVRPGVSLEIIPASCKVSIGEIADQVSSLSSDQQAIFLAEFFDALRFRCKDKFEMQLLFISDALKARPMFDDTVRSIETLRAFLNTVSESNQETKL